MAGTTVGPAGQDRRSRHPCRWRGLYLQVTDGRGAANRYWLFRYTQRAPPRTARSESDDKASRATTQAKAMTFDECRVAYIAAHEAGWRSAVHCKQWTSTLATYVTRCSVICRSRRSTPAS